MKKIFQSVLEFLETKSGFLILGFLVTTVCGSLLNYQIQTKQSENNQNFEMYKTRLSEAKNLQKNLLERATARSFYLQQVLVRLAQPEKYKPDEIHKYWNDHVSPSKDCWNKDLYYLHAQARTLFTADLADMLLVYNEDLASMRDSVIEKLDEATYRRTKPRSLQGAFINAHATVYHIYAECKNPRDCDRTNLLKLAEKQIKYLDVVKSCLAYRISSELLQYPYGPKAWALIHMPEQCVNELESRSSRES
jgi:hypothetical protein